MSSTFKFDDDAFISYCHIDNQALDDNGKGWVDNLHERLEYRLGELLGRKPKIWRDPMLPGDVNFSEALKRRIANTVTLICVLSPGYLQSEWCLRELQEFCRLAREHGSWQIGESLRIFKVVKTQIERADHPPEVQGQIGYEFYEIEQKTKRPLEFSQELGRNRDQRYWDKLNDLAWDIKQVLDSARPSVASPSPVPALASSQGNVYLAETTYDLTEERDKIRRELQNRGYQILPDREIPYKTPDYQEVVYENLKRCKLSIHLIGASYGIIPEGAGNSSIIRLQNELAAKCSRETGFSRLIWLPEKLEPREEQQAQFIEYLRTSADQQKGAELLQTTLEELKTVIQVRLSNNGQQSPARSSGDLSRPKIYLICDRRDAEGIAPLTEYLYEKKYEVLWPLIDEDEADASQAIELHKDNLVQCDAILIYYGSANQAWFEFKRRDLEKVAGYNRSRPLLAKIVYVTGPMTTHKQLFKSHEALVIKNFEPFSPELLDPFLAQIETAERGEDDARN